MSQLALIYARVSSERQKNEGSGLDSQEHRCQDYALSKGYDVEKVFRDSFTGGGDFMKRPAMVELLKHVDSHGNNNYVVIFDDLSRFARDVSFHIKLRSEFKARDIKPECLNFNFDDSPEGEMVEIMMAAQNQYHRKSNRRQVIQKQKARLERGCWTFCHPTGYRYEKHSEYGSVLVPVSPEAEIIKLAFEGYASDKFYDQVSVRNFLRLNNFRNGKPVHMSLVKRILTEILYTGYIEYLAWEVERRKGNHEAIISLETFERVQKKLNGKAYLISRKDYRLDFPLRGFTLCEECGGGLTAAFARGKYPYYWCKQGGCSLKNKMILRTDIEGKFDALLKDVKPRPEILELANKVLLDVWNERVGKLEDHRSVLEKKLQEVKDKIGGLAAKLAKTDNEDLISVYEDQLIQTKREERILADRVGRLSARSGDFEEALKQMFAVLRNPAAVWAKPDITQKRSVLKLIFSAKLRYDPVSGFQTPEKSLIYGLFEQISAQKSQDVEVRGIGPRSESVYESVSTTHSPD